MNSQPERQGTLKVLFVVDSRFPAMGGAESQALKLAISLREQGVHVDFLTPHLLLDQPRHETYLGFEITRFSFPHIKYLGTVCMMFNFARCLMKRRNQYSCVHIHITRFLSATAGVVRPVTKLPVMTKISGFFEFEGGILDMRGGFQPLNWLLRRAMRNIDHVHTISQQTRLKLIDAGFSEEQIKFIPNGIDTHVQPVERNSGGPLVIGYCGRLRHVKGVHVLIQAIAVLKRKYPDRFVELRIAGDGSMMKELRELVVNNGIDGQVMFLGAVSDTISFYEGLDIYVQPSFSEGLPNSVIEAMNAARPVVASNIGGNQDLVVDGETGFLFPAGDADQLAEKLVSLIDDSAHRRAMGAAGRDRIVTHFDIDRVVEQLIELYNEK